MAFGQASDSISSLVPGPCYTLPIASTGGPLTQLTLNTNKRLNRLFKTNLCVS